MKKRLNKHITRFVTGTVSASVLLSSCVPFYEEKDTIYSDLSKEDLGKIAIPISVKIKPEKAKYAAFLQKLTNDIIKNPVIAREFSKNPSLFLERYGYDEKINLDEGLLKTVLALGDEDINRAIKLNDIKLFLSLCKEKGLTNQTNSAFSSLIDQTDLQNKLSEMGLNFEDDELNGSIVFVAFIIAIAGFVVYVVAYDEVAVGQEYYGSVKKRNVDLITDSNPVLNLWTLKDKDKQTLFVIDGFLEDQLNDIVSVIKETRPTYFERNTEDDVKNFLRLNLFR